MSNQIPPSWLPAGQPLPYKKLLGTPRKPLPTRDQAPAACFLVVPSDDADDGQHPRNGLGWINAASIRLLDANTGAEVRNPRKGLSYKVQATIANKGEIPSLLGFAEFFVANLIDFDQQLGFRPDKPKSIGIPGHIHIPAAPKFLGVRAFTVPLRNAKVVECPNLWSPASDGELSFGVLVRVFDPLVDKNTSEWDSLLDRHIARRHLSPEFAGSWRGGSWFRNMIPKGPVAHSDFDIDLTIGAQSLAQTEVLGPKNGMNYPSGNFEFRYSLFVTADGKCLGQAFKQLGTYWDGRVRGPLPGTAAGLFEISMKPFVPGGKMELSMIVSNHGIVIPNLKIPDPFTMTLVNKNP